MRMTAARKSYEEAKASLACEGIYLTEDEDRFLGAMIEQGIGDDEAIGRIIERFNKRHATRIAAE